MLKVFGLIGLVIGLMSVAYGQGTVEGTVMDATTSQPIPFVKVKVEGQNKGAVTDFDGKFKFPIAAGNYTLVFTESEYKELKQAIDVVNGAPTVLDIKLDLNVITIKGDFTVVGFRQTPKSLAGDDVRRADANSATDGMTKEQMKATGDGDAGEAIQRVPGVSVQGGKHVFVRGLGDRYTKTILNGVEIPGLDPDRNTVQLDIFPTALIDNITVYKTFTPDLSGDFTGGLIDVTTKEFPSKKEVNMSMGLGYNSLATFSKRFIGAEAATFDYFGFDDGSRALPFSPSAKIPDVVLDDVKTAKLTKAFDPNMAPVSRTAFFDHNYGLGIGNSFKSIFGNDNFDYGYNVAFTYNNSNTLREMQYGEYRREGDASVNKLDAFRTASGLVASNNVLWTALAGHTLKYKKRNKFNMTVFHTQNGENTATSIREVNIVSNPATLIKQGVQFQQRQITNLDLNGTHKLENWKLEWKVAPTYSKIYDPDMRSTIMEEMDYVDSNGQVYYQYELNAGVGAEIRRMYRDLREFSFNERFDATYKFRTWDSLKTEIKMGAASLYKARTFDVYTYNFRLDGTNVGSIDPNYYFQEENVWNPGQEGGTYVVSSYQPANSYSGKQMVNAGYVMHELPFSKKFKTTYGFRAEHAMNYYTGENNSGTVVYDNENVLNEFNILPSINSVYKVKKGEKGIDRTTTNFRASYAMTVARPSFREKSIAQIYDPILGRAFSGNIDLQQTEIHNMDFRFEHFYGRTELISASVFYKRFINPIEIATYTTAPREVQPINSGIGDLYGLELEARKTIGFRSEDKQHMNFMVGANYNYILSQIDMTKVFIEVAGEDVSEYDQRIANAREGETVSKFRPMYGQSPYAVNAFATFGNSKAGWNANVSYNVQGKRLAVIGVGLIPDVYEQSFHSLNMKVSKAFGENKQWTGSISANNLLNQKRSFLYESYGAESQIYSEFKPGVNVSAKIAYTIK